MSTESGLQNIWSSDYVQKNPNKAYKASYANEYNAVAAYLSGGVEPNFSGYSKLGKGLCEIEKERRSAQQPVPPEPPDPPDPGPAGVIPPIPPSAYSIPAGATAVSNAAQLVAALSGSPKDIVCEDGTYDQATAFVNSGAHRIYARNLGKAVFKAGLVMGGNGAATGAVARGLAFNTVPGANLQDGAQILTWGGAGVNAQILDCTFEGNWTTEYGIRARTNQGLVCQRLRFLHFRDVGLRASDNVHAAYPGGATAHILRITDIYADGVAYNPPGSSGGVAEAAVWIGHPVDSPVERLELHDVGRKALETVSSSRDTIFRDLHLDMTGPKAQAGGICCGVYLEHNNYNNIYEKFYIVGVNRGFNGEWNENTPGNAGAQHCTIRNGTVDAKGYTRGGNTAGVYLDTGCDSNTVTGCTFIGQNWAGVGAHNNIGTNKFDPNDYSQMGATAKPLQTGHIFA